MIWRIIVMRPNSKMANMKVKQTRAMNAVSTIVPAVRRPRGLRVKIITLVLSGFALGPHGPSGGASVSGNASQTQLADWRINGIGIRFIDHGDPGHLGR